MKYFEVTLIAETHYQAIVQAETQEEALKIADNLTDKNINQFLIMHEFIGKEYAEEIEDIELYDYLPILN